MKGKQFAMEAIDLGGGALTMVWHHYGDCQWPVVNI